MRALKHALTKYNSETGLVTTQAHEGIETMRVRDVVSMSKVTTQAHEGIETVWERQ